MRLDAVLCQKMREQVGLSGIGWRGYDLHASSPARLAVQPSGVIGNRENPCPVSPFRPRKPPQMSHWVFLTGEGGASRFRRAKRGACKGRPPSCIDRSMADKKPPEDALSDLRRRVDAARGTAPQNSPPPQSPASLALRFGGEFGAAIIVGALLGYGADNLLHTTPWGLVIGMGLGFVAGVVNVVRVARSYSRSNPVDPNAPSIPDGEED